jgi:hypothetical protein
MPSGFVQDLEEVTICQRDVLGAAVFDSVDIDHSGDAVDHFDLVQVGAGGESDFRERFKQGGGLAWLPSQKGVFDTPPKHHERFLPGPVVLEKANRYVRWSGGGSGSRFDGRRPF